jgi:formate C-acetyltransferase
MPAVADRHLEEDGVMVQAAQEEVPGPSPLRGSTERVRKLRQEVLTQPWEVCIERARCYTEVYRSHADQPLAVVRALALAKTLQETPVRIYDGELLVGHRTAGRVGSPLYPEVKSAWIENELDLFASRELQRFQISEDDKATLRSEILPFWRDRGARDRVSALLSSESADALATLVFVVENEFGNGVGHCSYDYRMLVELGLNGIRAKAEARMRGLDPATEKGARELQFLRAVGIACDGVIQFAARYARLADELALAGGAPAHLVRPPGRDARRRRRLPRPR